MADSRLSDLSAAASVGGTDLLYTVQAPGVGGVKATVQQLATTVTGSTTLPGATVTTSQPVSDLTQTWNAGAVTFTAVKLNVTDTTSAAGSLLMDLQVGGATQFKIDKTGTVTIADAYKLAVALNSYPSIRPSLLLDFANSKVLDPRITYSRASTATYYDGKTVAKAEENLLSYSQQFDDAYWSKSAGTVTANATTAPDGASTADGLVESNTTSEQSVRRLSGLSASASTVYTLSVYAQKGSRDFVFVDLIEPSVANNRTWFNLATGAVGTNAAGNTASIQSVGGGWYRCVISRSTSGSQTSVYVTYGAAPTDGTVSYAGNGSTAIYLWGAQLEQRSSVTAYTPTTTQPITNYIPVLQTAASGVPRFDHNPVTGESLGLLIEEQRTNLLTYSSAFDNAAWTKSASSIVQNTIIAPDGTLTGDKLVENSANAVHRVQSSNGFTGVHTLSVYAKAAERSWLALNFANLANAVASFNLNSGTIGSYQSAVTPAITPVGNGWYRCSITTTLTSASTPDIITGIADNVITYIGNGFSGIYIWGAQLEAGSFATSYIATTSSQVTRAADSASMTGTNFSSWYSAGEGTLYADVNTKALSVSSGVQVNDASTNNNIRLALASVTDQGTVTVSGVAQSTLDGGTPAANTNSKFAIAYKTNDFALSLNGGTAVLDTSGIIPVVTQLQIGAETSTYGTLTLKKVAYWPKRLTDTTLQALTS